MVQFFEILSVRLNYLKNICMITDQTSNFLRLNYQSIIIDYISKKRLSIHLNLLLLLKPSLFFIVHVHVMNFIIKKRSCFSLHRSVLIAVRGARGRK